jgi:hypothetical protein
MELVVVPAGGRRSPLDRLRRGPTQPAALGLIEALRRVEDARELGVDNLDLSRIPAGRLKLLAHYASTARAQAIQPMPAERAIATLVALASTAQANAQDDVLDVLDRVLTYLLARVHKQERQQRLRTIGDLDTAALGLRDLSLVVLDQTRADHTLRTEIFARWPRERIEQAAATVGALARPPENSQAPEALLNRYSMVRQFLPSLLKRSPHRRRKVAAPAGGLGVLAPPRAHAIASDAPGTLAHRHAGLVAAGGPSRQDRRPTRIHLLCTAGDTRRVQTPRSVRHAQRALG